MGHEDNIWTIKQKRFDFTRCEKRLKCKPRLQCAIQKTFVSLCVFLMTTWTWLTLQPFFTTGVFSSIILFRIFCFQDLLITHFKDVLVAYLKRETSWRFDSLVVFFLINPCIFIIVDELLKRVVLFELNSNRINATTLHCSCSAAAPHTVSFEPLELKSLHISIENKKTFVFYHKREHI